jgi:branched-chain amino acid transport system substrate-binding protein
VAAFLDPAGLEKATGIISNARSKGWLHRLTQSDPDVREFLDWMARYNPHASLDTELGMLRPGIRLQTSATDYQPIKQLFLIRFDGREWQAL